MAKKIINNDDIEDSVDREVIKSLRSFLNKSNSYNASIFQRTKEEEAFACGDQFDAKDDVILGLNGARITLNYLGKYENSVVNKFSTRPYGITVSAKSNNSVKNAEKLTSLVRGIEFKSSLNDIAVDCLRSAVRTGYSYLYVTTDYKNDESFDQEIIISSVRNSRCVAFDVESKALDGSDSNEIAFIDFMSEDEAISKHGKDITRESKYSLNGMSLDYDIPEDSIPYVTYFKKIYTSTKFYKLPDGRTGKKEDFTEEELKSATSRDLRKCEVKVYKIIGNKVESETTLPISYIPVVPVYGKKIILKGKNQYAGIVYDSKDACRLINYNASKMAERIARAPKNQWISPEEAINNDPNWANADTGLYSVLTYKEKDLDGNAIINKPMLQQSSVDIADVLTAKTNFEQSLSDIVGIPIQGSDGMGMTNETTVGAIIRKDTIASNNSHFYYNLKSSLRHLGRIILEMIPIYYDTPREELIIDASGKPVKVNVDVTTLNIKPGDYDVVLDAGPIELNERQDTLASLVSFAAMLTEQQRALIAPDVARLLPHKDAEIIAAKLEKTIPAEMLDARPENDPVLESNLQMANDAITALSAEKEAIQQALNMAYQNINSLQSYITAEKEKTQADILMNSQDNQTEIQKVAIQEDGQNKRTSARILADAEKERLKQQNKLDELSAKAPKTVVVVNPDGNIVKPVNRLNV